MNLDINSEKSLFQFFSSSKNERYYHVNYEEYLTVFGKSVDEQYLSKINKRIISGHLDYYNQCFDSYWEIKWLPLFFKFAFNCARLRPTSITLSVLYIFGFDFFFQKYFMYLNSKVRNIDITELFKFRLIRPQYIEARKRIATRYLDAINSRKGEFEPEKKNVIFAGISKNKIFYNLSRNNETWKEHNYFIDFCKRIKIWTNDYENFLDNIKSQKVFTLKKFREYKSSFHSFPEMSDYKALLNYSKIDGAKLFSFREDFKLKVEHLFNGMKYIFIGANEFQKINFRFLHHHDITDERKPYYGLKNSVADLLIFSIMCILPSKVLAFRNKRIQKIMSKARLRTNS